MEVIEGTETEERLAPKEGISLSLENTSAASHYFITVDTGTTGEFPLPYAHRVVGDVPGGERQFDGTGRARAIAYSMPAADSIKLEIQNITHRVDDIIISESEEGTYRIRFYALSFD